MKELKAWKLTLENKKIFRRYCIYHVCETESEAKRFYEENWSRLQYLVKIEDISHTKKGSNMIRSHLFLKGD